jgi:excisionase family DNA binding protein
LPPRLPKPTKLERLQAHVTGTLAPKESADPMTEASFRAAVVQRLDAIVGLMREQDRQRLQEFLAPDEAAIYMGIHSETVRALCRRGELRHVKVSGFGSGKIRIKKTWIDEWATKNPVAPKAG